MRLFKLFNAERLPPPKHSESRLYAINLDKLSPPFTMPKEYSDASKFSYSMQVHYTLCDPAVGLYGRTAV
jgi:hypothetical protein